MSREGGLRLPSGLHHVLFLFALLLAGGGLRSRLLALGAFAAGSGLTLSLAGYGLLGLPEAFADAAIALTVVYAAVEAALVKDLGPRWPLAGAFGLVHGLGLAGGLSGLHLARPALAPAVLWFGVGALLGLFLLVALVAPLAALAVRRESWRPAAMRACAGVLAATGAIWFLRSLFG